MAEAHRMDSARWEALTALLELRAELETPWEAVATVEDGKGPSTIIAAAADGRFALIRQGTNGKHTALTPFMTRDQIEEVALRAADLDQRVTTWRYGTLTLALGALLPAIGRPEAPTAGAPAGDAPTPDLGAPAALSVSG